MQGQSGNNEWEEYNNSSHNDVGETADDAQRATTQTPNHAGTNMEGDDSFSAVTNRIESQERNARSVGLETIVFSCGQNAYGELGHQHTQERFTPEAVEFLNGRHQKFLPETSTQPC